MKQEPSSPSKEAIPPEARVLVSRLSSEEDFLALRQEWNDLVSHSRSDTICLTWEWLWTWWQVFGCERKLALIEVRDVNGALDAIAPFAIRSMTYGMLPPIRRLEMLGSGEPEQDAIWSEYLDVIARRGREAESLAAIADYLAESGEWDAIYFGNTLDHSLASGLGAKLSARGMRAAKFDATPSYFLSLPSDPDEVGLLLTPRTRRKLNHYLRKGANLGGFQLDSCQSEAVLVEWFENLIVLHRRRWNARGQRGVFASESFCEFHRKIASLLWSQGKLVLYAMTYQGRKVAIIYGFRHGETISAYQSGFDVQCDPKISLGLVAWTLSLREAIRSGAKELDFLRGDEPYKRLWPVARRTYLDTYIWRRGINTTLNRWFFLGRCGVRAQLKKCLTFLGMRRRKS